MRKVKEGDNEKIMEKMRKNGEKKEVITEQDRENLARDIV
jgi:hypothetical protein